MSRSRQYRTPLLVAATVAALAIGGYLLYEMGRIHAGFNRFTADEQVLRLNKRIAELEIEVAALDEARIQLETTALTEQETYREVSGTLRELQEKIQEQREAIAFYRGIISPEESESGLRIQDLEVLRDGDADRYRLRMVIVQVRQHHRQVYGKVRLTVDGAMDGEVVSLPYARLLPDGATERWNYGFRYFQDFERELEMPDGFTPQRINVELEPTGRGNTGIKQTFDWSTSTG